MYNDMISIQSEYLYESIMLESDTSKSKGSKIKEIWKLLVGFIKKIKDSVLTFIRSKKQEIMTSEVEIEYKDYSDMITSYKRLLQAIKSKDPDYRKYDPCKDFTNPEIPTIKGKKSVAIKQLEKWLHEIHSISQQINREVDKLDYTDDESTMHVNYMEVIGHDVRMLVTKIKNEVETCVKKGSTETESSDKNN